MSKHSSKATSRSNATTAVAPAGATKSSRLLSLDVLRGITVAGMLLVNNPGSWGSIYAPLEHAEWIGLTPTDLVFPFFVFVMGVSMAFSLRAFDYKPSGAVLYKIIKRTIILFLIGWAVGWFSHLMYGLHRGDPFAVAVNNIPTIRILGVFQRLALCYLCGSLIAISVKHKSLPWLTALILTGYALLLGFGKGYEFSLDNIIARVDNAVLGENHMYHERAFGEKIAFDPEGLLSTIPCIAHVLIGFMTGLMLLRIKDNSERMQQMLLWGFVMMLVAWLLGYGIPVGKKMWSSTFVLATCGLAMSVSGLLTWVIDIKGKNRWCRPLQAFGMNPLAIYTLGTVLAIVFNTVTLCHDINGKAVTVHSAIYDGYCALMADKAASALFAITFVAINYIVAHILMKKKIYIKI